MSKTRIIGKHATEIITNIIPHDWRLGATRTIVVVFDRESIKLDSGGWHTATTKLRMNQVSNQYDLGYLVFQIKGEWFVEYRGEDIPFYDGMILRRIGV